MLSNTPAPQIVAIQHATIPLGRLISAYELGLVMISGSTEETPESPVQWVHGSDLFDPTPFLPPRTVLLTTGVQFSEDLDEETADAYIAKLQDAGVCALGFSIGIAHERIPQALILASESRTFPLFRVPYDTQFIAISQTAARLIDAELHARDTWSLEAQRAISQAALRPDGIDSALRELAARIGRWVAITDPRGRIVSHAPGQASSIVTSRWIRDESAALVSRGIRSSKTVTRGELTVHFQTLGHGQRRRGALLVEGDVPLDHAEQTAVGLVATLATIHLDQSSALSDADADLRGALVRLMVAGHVSEAKEIAGQAVPHLPSEPLRVFHLGALESVKRAFLEDLRSFSTGLDGSLLGAINGDLVMLIEPGHVTEALAFFRSSQHTGGLSRRTDYAGLPRALRESARAAEVARTRGMSEVLEYSPSMSAGVFSLLASDPRALEQAQVLLHPIRAHDEKHGEDLFGSLQVWLAQHGQTSPAATRLGIHRHTLKTRLDTVARLLERDLADPSVRMELWAAFKLVG